MTRALVPIALAGVLTGCLMIPVDYYAKGSRRNVDADVRAQLQPGVTSMEDVLLLLGEPDQVSTDGRHIGYAWHRAKAWVLVGAYYAGGAAQVQKDYLLRISFDADYRVSAVEMEKAWHVPGVQ